MLKTQYNFIDGAVVEGAKFRSAAPSLEYNSL